MLRKWPGLPSRMPSLAACTRISNVEASETLWALRMRGLSAAAVPELQRGPAARRDTAERSGAELDNTCEPTPVACALYYLSARSR